MAGLGQRILELYFDFKLPTPTIMEQLINPFQGLPRPEARRRRRAGTAGDPESEIGSNLPLGPLNNAGPSHGDSTSTPTSTTESPTQTPSQSPATQLIIELTVNRICRIATILTLGIWCGWSVMPAETKVPLSPTWVAYICIIIDWIVLSTNLDCIFPRTMDWYFRDCPKWRVLIKEDVGLEVRITGYHILSTSIILGSSIFIYFKQDDQQLLNRSNLVTGGFIAAGLVFLGCVKGKPGSPGAWFFYNDHSVWIFKALNAAMVIFYWLSWWWIALRTLAIVHILRNRRKPELALQFLTLTIGLTIEGTLLVSFFLMPVVANFFKMVRFDKDVWDCHLTALIAVFAFWLLVIIVGLWEDLPNIIFPCTGSESMICKFLVGASGK